MQKYTDVIHFINKTRSSTLKIINKNKNFNSIPPVTSNSTDLKPSLFLEDWRDCLYMKHCIDTRLVEGTYEEPICPHLFLSIEKMSHDQKFAIIFVTLLFAAIISRDIEESSTEEALHEYIVSKL